MSDVPPTEIPALRVERLCKRYPRRRSMRELVGASKRPREWTEALRGVSFRMAQGELVGLLGPNGAGKTTLLKVLCGLVLADAGRAEVLGISSSLPFIPRMIGLANGDERSFYWRLTARENLNFFARLHGLHRERRRRRVQELLERVELGGEAERRFGDLSAGMKQRLAVARALLSDAPVLLMDEPTRSLDPVHSDRMVTWIRSRLHGEHRKSILLATHDLHVARRICDRVLVLVDGQVRMDGPPAMLTSGGWAGARYAIGLRGVSARSLEVGEVVAETPRKDGAVEFTVHFAEEDDLHRFLSAAMEKGGQVLSCARQEASIEDGFMGVVSREGASS